MRKTDKVLAAVFTNRPPGWMFCEAGRGAPSSRIDRAVARRRREPPPNARGGYATLQTSVNDVIGPHVSVVTMTAVSRDRQRCVDELACGGAPLVTVSAVSARGLLGP